jgi:hypothetical protein
MNIFQRNAFKTLIKRVNLNPCISKLNFSTNNRMISVFEQKTIKVNVIGNFNKFGFAESI